MRRGRAGRGRHPALRTGESALGPHPAPIPPEGLGRPAPPAVAFETHSGIPVLDRKGVGATLTQDSYLLRGGDSSRGGPWGGLWALDPRTLSCQALERGRAGAEGE